MAKLPPPPSPLTTPPEVRVLRAGTLLFRIYKTAGAHPATWDRLRDFGPLATCRFDHHDPPPHRQANAILYAAADATTCIAEVFQETRVVDRTLDAPWLVGFALRRSVRLLDLTGAWPTRAGASMAIGTGRRDRARLWSRAIHAAYPDVEGLLYGSSMHANRPSVALYERARSAIPAAPRFHRALADASLGSRLAAAARRLGYRIV